MSTKNSRNLFDRARSSIVGGVNSPSRSYDAVGAPYPTFMSRGSGPYLFDADGNRYIDYLGAYGALILGHGHPAVTDAVCAQAPNGTVFGTPTELECRFAEKLQAAIPSLEKVRFTVSGTEAVMTAIRVARGYTSRAKILKFGGCYHGHSDLVLVEAGSGSSTLGITDSAGIPDGVRTDVITVPYNDPNSLTAAFERYGNEIAAVLVEPVVGNFGIVAPQPGFLERIQRLARGTGALVIWDEVITAFRFRYGSIQDFFSIRPDLVTLGKIIGGGLPIGAYGGRAEVMDVVAPVGTVYQDGTLAGNPLSMAAGLACLEVLQEPGLYDGLAAKASRLQAAILESSQRHGHEVQVNRFEGALSLFFTDREVTCFRDTEASDSEKFGRCFRLLLEKGINTAPSKYEAWFVSAAHTDADIDYTIEAVEAAFREL